MRNRECQASWVPLHVTLLVLFKVRHNYDARHKNDVLVARYVSASKWDFVFLSTTAYIGFITVIVRTTTEPSTSVTVCPSARR